MEELIYTIDHISSGQDDALLIKIQVAKRDQFLFIPLEHQPPLTHDKLLSIASPKDSTFLPFLINEENTYLKRTAGRGIDRKLTSLHHIHVSPKETLQALKLLATTGKAHFKGRSLVIDLYSPAELFYSSDTGDSIPHAIAWIKPGSQEIELTSCDFIGKGPPRFFIKGVQLKIFSTDISWKDLKLAFEGKSRPLHELIEEAAEDPEAPRVRCEGKISKRHMIEPLPILVLKDRLGAFAELNMDYGQGGVVSYHDPHLPAQAQIARALSIEEAWEKDLLETDFIKKSVGTSHYYCPLDKVAKSIAFLLEIGWHILDSKGNKVLLQGQVDLHAEMQGANILVKGKVHYGNFEASLQNIVGAFNRRDRFAEIMPGHSALLPSGWEQTGIETLVEEGEVVSDGLQMKKHQIGSLAALFETLPTIRLEPDIKLLSERIQSFQGMKVREPGVLFTGALRPYQQEGLNWLSFLYDFGFHGMLADDMGLGKTVQVIAFLSTLQLQQPVLIIVPTTLIFNWKRELERFFPSLQAIIHHGSKRTSSVEKLMLSQAIITTYTTLRRDFSLFSQISYDCLILDEAQAIKNAHTQTAQTVQRLDAAFRLSITGTPVENNLMELWSHFQFLMPDLFGDQKGFETELQAGMSDTRFYRRIKRKIRPFLLRRTKEEVAKDLPEKIEQTVWVEMGEEQRTLYEHFLSGVRCNLLSKVSMDGMSKHRMEVLEAIMRLRQICCHPLLIAEECRESAKLDALIDDLETAIEEKRKVLIYSQFTSMLSLIGKRVKDKGWNSVYLDGQTQNREKVVFQFQEDPAISFFLISLKAGGVGLNLTAADYVFLYDPWWNHAVEDQAIDRAHRIGRKDTVIAKRYIMVETIEEKMMKLKAAKSALSAELIDDHSALSTLSIDDLLFLIS